MPTVSMQPRLDSSRAARFVEVYQLCINAGQNHDDIASACGITPPNLQNIIDAGGFTTQNVLSRLENWARLTHIELPPRIAPTPGMFQTTRNQFTGDTRTNNGMHSNDAHTIEGNSSSSPGLSAYQTRPADTRSKASEQQHAEFQSICDELKTKYKLKVQERLRATGYRSLTGLTFAIRNGPSMLVYERARFIRNALLAGTFTKDQAFEEAEKRWPIPKDGRHGPRKRRKGRTDTAAAPAAVETAAPVATTTPGAVTASTAAAVEAFAPAQSAVLDAGIRDKLIRGFSIIEQAGLELSRISDSLRELATDPGMPRTVRKTAGEMLQGLTAHTLPILECEPDAVPAGT